MKTETLITYLIAGVAVLLVISIFSSFGLYSELDKKLMEAKENARPAEIKLTIIEDKSCNGCFDIKSIVDGIKRNNVNATEEKTLEFNSEKAKEFIGRFKIKKIPTIIVEGEINKSGNMGLTEENGALVFTAVEAPYVNAANGEVMGLVSLVYIKDSGCSDCQELIGVIDGLKQGGIAIVNEETIERSSTKGGELIAKYKLNILPSLILSKEISAYPSAVAGWNQIGTIESDGSYILRFLIPPYLNLTTNKVAGLLNVILLTDESCSDCYDVNIHDTTLTRLGFFIAKEETIDIASSRGKELIKKYSITKAPTFVLSKEANDYPAVSILKQVGTFEADGNFVFRKVEVMGGKYKDLDSGEIVGV